MYTILGAVGLVGSAVAMTPLDEPPDQVYEIIGVVGEAKYLDLREARRARST